MISETSREDWMRQALDLAKKAGEQGEVPVGAVVVSEGKIIGRGFNLRETRQQAVLHAEIVAIQEASALLGSWRLEKCELYVTLEPCLMCAGAIYQARLPRVIFGAFDPKAGACGSLFRIHEDGRLNHRFAVEGEILADESRVLLQSFFRNRRT